MALSDLVRRVLGIATASPGAAKELADAVDGLTSGAGALTGNNTYTGTNTHSGAETFSNTLTASSLLVASRLELGPAPADTYGAAMTIDVTKSLHVISASNTTSAAVTLTPSAAGTAGDLLTILTEADGTGTVTATFASTFHSSGTQATTLSHFSSITFQSDGTRWIELCRTTNLA